MMIVIITWNKEGKVIKVQVNRVFEMNISLIWAIFLQAVWHLKNYSSVACIVARIHSHVTTSRMKQNSTTYFSHILCFYSKFSLPFGMLTHTNIFPLSLSAFSVPSELSAAAVYSVPFAFELIFFRLIALTIFRSFFCSFHWMEHSFTFEFFLSCTSLKLVFWNEACIFMCRPVESM